MSSSELGPDSRPPPGSTSSLRAANQRRVVRLLQSAGSPLSQADIARSTQLAPATVSNIVRDLTASGIVDTAAGGGRRGTAVWVARSAGLVAGVDFGHRHVRVAVADLAGQILKDGRERIQADHSSGDGLTLAAGLLDRLLSDVGGDRGELRTVGLGLPAPITNEDLVISSAILPGWIGVDAGAESRRTFGCDVHIENDANLGAVAEHHAGAGIGHPTMVFVKASSGVGAGLIIEGRLFRGSNGSAGEVGHLVVDERGPLCRCGNRGCLETYASTDAAEALAAHQLASASLEEVIAAAAGGHLGALRIFEDAGLHLGWGVAMLANLVNPSAVVVGGDMARAGQAFLDPVRTGLRRHALQAAVSSVVVRPAALGDRASVIGAVLLAVDRTELVPDRGVA